MELLRYLQEYPFLTGVPIIIVVFVLLMTGRLVPKSQVDRLMEVKNQQLAAAQREAETWHNAFDTRGEMTAEVLSQNAQLIAGPGQAVVHALESIQRKADEIR